MQLRKTQELAIARIIEAVVAGKTDIFLQAPTGTGKSLIALEVSRILREKHSTDSYLLTSEKSLQQQYEHDCTEKWREQHEDVASIAGVDTYTCDMNKQKFSLGVCRNMGMGNRRALKLPCAGTCEYLQRWARASESSRALMNYSYYLIQMNYVLPKMEEGAPFERRGVVICDEAHRLPDIIESHFACRLAPTIGERINKTLRSLADLGFLSAIPVDKLSSAITAALIVPEKAHNTKHLAKLEIALREYSLTLTLLNDLKERVGKKYRSNMGSVSAMKSMDSSLPREVRWFFSIHDQVKDQHCKLEDYVAIIKANGLDNMVVCDSGEERTYHNLSDSDLFKKHFLPHSKVRIYMSATLQPQLLMRRWKVDVKKAIVLNLKSTWESEKSPVILTNTANMSYKGGQRSLDRATAEIDRLLSKHKNERGVIHTTTNAVAAMLLEDSRFSHRFVTYKGTAEKMEILSNLDSLKPNAVLVGPSLFTGTDLGDDLARFNIIVKLSFPTVASALWSKRFNLQPNVYFGETAAVLEQSAGRTTRHKNDHSVTYVLDDRASAFIKRSESFFSPTFLDRVRN